MKNKQIMKSGAVMYFRLQLNWYFWYRFLYFIPGDSLEMHFDLQRIHVRRLQVLLYNCYSSYCIDILKWKLLSLRIKNNWRLYSKNLKDNCRRTQKNTCTCICNEKREKCERVTLCIFSIFLTTFVNHRAPDSRSSLMLTRISIKTAGRLQVTITIIFDTALKEKQAIKMLCDGTY